MASQRILLLTIGGPLADVIWADVCRWSNARSPVVSDEWSSDDWPSQTRVEVDSFVARLAESAYLPPVLYRSEYIDLWSMGDVFATPLERRHPDQSRKLYTSKHEVTATWVQFLEKVRARKNAPPETLWLYSRLNEAIGAWEGVSENRLLLFVRTIVGGLWEDEEVIDAVRKIPIWWVGEQCLGTATDTDSATQHIIEDS
ncbi:MAG: hypothetical protein O2856_02210 [Planctomycetota bacterium]|nr:hypothetical protein [Planctomycetota bacterium]